MAKDKKAPEANSIENLNEQLTKASRKVQENKKVALWVISALVCVGLFFCAWLYFFHLPRIEKSFEEYGKVETVAMGNDSIAAEQYMKVADTQSGDAANLAALEAGQSLYELGKYEQAIKYFKKFSTKDEVLKANTQILIGDCYVNLKKYGEALPYFEKGVNEANGNPQIAPRALFKIATVYEAQKKYAEAQKTYEQIEEEYPDFSLANGMTVTAYIERAKARQE